LVAKGQAEQSPEQEPVEMVATPEELNARHVKGVTLLFLPSLDLKRNLEGITFDVPQDAPGTLTA
jgi:hypothetical protein